MLTENAQRPAFAQAIGRLGGSSVRARLRQRSRASEPVKRDKIPSSGHRDTNLIFADAPQLFGSVIVLSFVTWDLTTLVHEIAACYLR